MLTKRVATSRDSAPIRSTSTVFWTMNITSPATIPTEIPNDLSFQLCSRNVSFPCEIPDMFFQFMFKKVLHSFRGSKHVLSIAFGKRFYSLRDLKQPVLSQKMFPFLARFQTYSFSGIQETFPFLPTFQTCSFSCVQETFRFLPRFQMCSFSCLQETFLFLERFQTTCSFILKNDSFHREISDFLLTVFKKRFLVIDEHYLHIWQLNFQFLHIHRHALPGRWDMTSIRSSSNVFWTIYKETLNTRSSTVSSNVRNWMENSGWIMSSVNVFWTMKAF